MSNSKWWLELGLTFFLQLKQRKKNVEAANYGEVTRKSKIFSDKVILCVKVAELLM